MLYGAEAVAYLVQRLYQSLSEEIAMALCTFFCSPISHKGKPKTLSKSRQTNNKSIMALFQVTAQKETSGMGPDTCKKLPKGATFQVLSKNSSEPTAKEIADAIKRVFGIQVSEGNCLDMKGYRFSRFKCEKIGK